MSIAIRCVLFGLITVMLGNMTLAQPPTPKWAAEMIDQGEADPRLKGLRAPRGMKVEVAADSLRFAASIGFDPQGALWMVQHSPLPSPRSEQIWDLLSLRDTDGDGRFETTDVVLSGLHNPAALVYDGWIYNVNSFHVFRRRQYEAALAARLEAEAAAKRGPPTEATRDKRWIVQRLVGGLPGREIERFGGLTAGLDGWIYLSLGGTDNRLESWDESQAAVLGSGAIFRFQANGSRVQEFARGFASPAGPPACDALGVLFLADRLSEGARLIQVLEGADYGWRSDLDPPQLDRPGTLPALVEAKSRNPAGPLVYLGDAFPKFFQRLLIVPESDERVVRAYPLTPDGVTLAAGEPVVLLASNERDFRPSQPIQGPDGAIYFADRSDRILRLSWSGTKDVPAIELPKAAAREKPADQPLGELLATAVDETNAAAARAAALAAACRQWNGQVLEACLKLIDQKDPDLARLAADALGDHLPDDMATQQRVASAMQNRLLVASLPARRSLYIALGKLGTRLETVPEWIFEATSVTPDVLTNRWLFEAHVRAAEMPQGWATELLIGNLEVALFDPNPEPEERQRLKRFVVATAECMRTRELTAFLERTIRDERDYFSKLDAPLQARLLAAWQNVLVDPPVRADAVAEWLAKHPAAAPEVQAAAASTLARLGTEKPDALVQVARQVLMAKADAALRGDIARALARHQVKDKPGEIDELVAALGKP